MPSLPATLIETEAEIQKAEERYQRAETPQAALDEALCWNDCKRIGPA